MSRKKQKFFIYVAKKSGYWKGKRLIRVNYLYEGGTDNFNLQDLIEFLNEKKINLSDVVLPSSFTTYAKCSNL